MHGNDGRHMNLGEWALLFALSLLWGGSFFFAKVALRELPPFTVALGRVGLAAATLGLVLAVLRQGLPRLRALWGAFLVMGLLNNLAPFSLIFWGQTTLTAGHAAILNATMPLFTVIVAHVTTTEERITPAKLAGMLAGFGGVVVMIGPGLAVVDRAFWAQVACLSAAFCYACAGVFGRRFRRLGVAPLQTAFGQLAATTLMLVPVVFIVDRPSLQGLAHPATLGALAGLAILSTALAYVVYFRLLATAGATNLSLVTLLIPASAALLGYAFLGERLGPGHLAGMSLIAAGLAAIDGRPLTALSALLPALLRPDARARVATDGDAEG
ncbi:DMT family transporter [Chelatococcus sp. SYSU_G07232]|uniref:DMT family transporter n=1 Tax=Chelatococcus albus TaxID=3047466 RepID=A0ABT7ADT9_9HYPH|nr:DMT family transporter [Chelatococcus sp. SYSU_G07232]MDJ1157545.1 DMT family transporter [Chelatococcus sp. SYSU_G07232]